MPLIEKVLKGDVLAAAKLMRRLEDNVPGAEAELQELYRHTGKAYIVGISGAPGAGKSTLLANLIGAFRKKKLTVGVVAIDPTSPLSGGAILGDRLRMQKHGEDKDVFIRSLASRAWKGGLSRATMNTVHVMDAMGKDVILVEAVGSGQGETDFARLADTSVLVLVPGMGDEIQALKAGIMEVADIFVINKSDREGAEATVNTVQMMLEMTHATPEAHHGLHVPIIMRDASRSKIRKKPKNQISEFWKPPVVLTEAINEKGTAKLVKEILRHKAFLAQSGGIEQRRRRRAELELTASVESVLREQMNSIDWSYLKKLIQDIAARKTDPNSAAKKIIKPPPTSPFGKGK